MKHQIILLFLFISTINAFNIQVYPIDKYKSQEIKKVNTSKLYFSLNIEDFQLNEEIYFEYSSSIKPFSSDVIYHWSKNNFKNITNITYPASQNECSGSSNSDFMGDVTYTIYCKIKKQSNEYKSLLIIVSSESYIGRKFKIENAKTSLGSTMLFIFLIIIIIIVVIAIIIGIIICYVIKKNKNNNYNYNYNYGFNPGFNNNLYTVNPNQNIAYPNQYNPPEIKN